MADLKATDLHFSEILPSSISGDKKFSAASESLNDHLVKLAGDTDLARIYSRIPELPEAALDLLAWQLHVDFWLPTLPIESKRSLVEGSIAWHRKKGTAWAVKQVLSDLGVDAEIIQWHQPGGEDLDRFTFAVRGMIRRPLLPTEMWGPETITEVERAISVAKNTRSWLGWLTLALEMDVPVKAPGHDLAQAARKACVAPLSFGPLFDRRTAEVFDESGIDQAPVARDETSAAWTMGRPWSLDMFYEEGSAGWLDQMIPGVEGAALPPADCVPVSILPASVPLSIAAAAAESSRKSHRIFIGISPDVKNNSTSTAPAYFGADEVFLDEAPGMDDVALDLCPLDALMEVAHA